MKDVVDGFGTVLCANSVHPQMLHGTNLTDVVAAFALPRFALVVSVVNVV